MHHTTYVSNLFLSDNGGLSQCIHMWICLHDHDLLVNPKRCGYMLILLRITTGGLASICYMLVALFGIGLAICRNVSLHLPHSI